MAKLQILTTSTLESYCLSFGTLMNCPQASTGTEEPKETHANDWEKKGGLDLARREE